MARLLLDDLGPEVEVKGHWLFETADTIWCKRCGHFSRDRVYALGSACSPSAKPSRGVRTRLARLGEGRGPYDRVTDPVRGTPRRLTLARWCELKGLEDPFLISNAVEEDRIQPVSRRSSTDPAPA